MVSPNFPNQASFDRVFFGEYERGLDKKGRMTLPASFREMLGDEPAFITMGLDGCLSLYPKTRFDEMRQKAQQKELTSSQAREFNRFFFGRAALAKPDSMGRINIPSALRKYAKLEKDAVVVGVNTHVEIWNPESWQEQQQKILSKAINEGWENLGI